MDALLCPWEPAQFLIVSENIPTLLYYSHIPSMVLALILGIFLFKKGTKDVSSRLLAVTLLLFVFWAFLDLFLWATNSPNQVIFWWSIIILVEPLIYIFSLYFIKIFIDKKNFSFKFNFGVTFLIGLLLLVLPTVYNLSGVYLSDCVAVEGPLALYYVYIIEILVAIFITAFCIRRYLQSAKEKNNTQSKKILLVGVGLLLFLLAFSFGNIVGSFTLEWTVAQFGLIGMPLFIIFLSYVIVKYKAFNMKLLSSQLLVMALAILIGAQFFFIESQTNFILNAIGFFLVIFSGYFLIKSVKQLEKKKEELRISNERQRSLMRFINHQVKGFFTRSKIIFDSLQNDHKKELSEEVQKLVTVGFDTNKEAVDMVKSLLDAANLEKGTIEYQKVALNFKLLVEETVESLRGLAENKNLKYVYDVQTNSDIMISGDVTHINQVIRNLIENAISYTEKGSIAIELKVDKFKKVAVFTVKDSGIGLDKNDMSQLFTQGGRGKRAQAVNVNSTGYGLYIAYQIVKEHEGALSAESEGENKGSSFVVTLPLLK